MPNAVYRDIRRYHMCYFFNGMHIIIVICGQNSILRKLLLTFLSTTDDVNANKSEVGFLNQ